MKTVSLLTILIFTQGALAMPSLIDLSFLSGCWKLEAGPSTQVESWSKPSENVMLGMSQRTVVGNKTVAYEFLRIEKTPKGEVAYTPYINGRQGPAFAWNESRSLITKDTQKAVFTNEANDFPKHIIYQKDSKSPDVIQVQLEGVGKNGQDQVMAYPMAAADCLSIF